MPSKAEKDQDRIVATNALRRALKPGDEICFVVTHVSRSGMQRSIEFYIAQIETRTEYTHHGSADNPPMSTTSRKVRRPVISRITWEMSRVLGYRIDQKHGGIVVGGCGMDMGFHCVYNLGMRLWPKGTRKPHGRRNGQPDSTGGYALKSRQI